MYSMPDGRTQPLFSKPALAFDLTLLPSLGRKSGYRNVARAEKHTASVDALSFLPFFNRPQTHLELCSSDSFRREGTINAVGFGNHLSGLFECKSREETSELVSQLLNAVILEKPAVVFHTVSTVVRGVGERRECLAR